MKQEPNHNTRAGKIGSRMTKVLACVAFKTSVEYEVQVKNPNDLQEIKRTLEKMDPADWLEDPNFYECFGFKWRQSVRKLTPKDVVKPR